MPQPDNEESGLWGSTFNPHGDSVTGKVNIALNQRMPELKRAGGAVDPTEALITLIDQVTALAKRIETLEAK